ncbi:ATP-Hypothetical protein cassette sub-family A ABC1 member [Nesidiocoris tenuis]|nr:ATP-Hypothetical protein cassette sub-family A ABC1 member [Nesidiocoris tenuis]
MTVEKGSIYGLLGPSGCGKSSLLNAMVGLVGLDGGEMCSIAEEKSDLGFMPQQIALHERLTVMEHISYFGQIYGLTEKQIALQSNELLSLLEISARSAEVGTLSGGQKRRLSLAVTLIHNPSLILLDEPTVGVDPVLRASIWAYLKRLTEKEEKTVIITTHYMEEATLANKIGLMRCGVLICEDSPANIVAQNNATSLEDVFVKLSHIQEAEILEDNRQMTPEESKKVLKKRKIKKNGQPLKWHRLKAEMAKNFKFIRRDIGTTMMTIVVPIIVALCFHYAVGREPITRLGILSEEVPYSTTTCLHWEPTSRCDFANLTCLFLNKLWDKNIITRDVPDLQRGIDMVKRSETWGVIEVRRNFSNFMYKLSNTKILDQDGEDELAIEHGSLKIHLDRSNAIMDEILFTHLYKSMEEAMKDIFEDCGWPSKLPQIPMKLETLFYGELTTDVRKSTSPALINIIMLTIPMMYGVIAIIEERVSGATARSVAAGVTPYELLASHFGVQLFIHTSQLLGVVVVMYGLLGYEFKNPIVGLSLLFLQGLPGIAISFFMPLVIETPFLANYYCCGFIVANAISCGAIWPIEALHPLAHAFAWLLPTYYSSPALRDANFKGWDVSWRTLVYGYTSLGVWTIVLSVAIIVRVRATGNRCFLGKN